MTLRMDPNSPVPAYEQLRSQLVRLVMSQVLPPGTRLSTVRQLAADLGLAKDTVARTYRILEESGVIETRGRNGTFVAESSPKRSAADRRKELAVVAEEYAVAALQLGATLGEATAALVDAFEEFGEQ